MRMFYFFWFTTTLNRTQKIKKNITLVNSYILFDLGIVLIFRKL